MINAEKMNVITQKSMNKRFKQIIKSINSEIKRLAKLRYTSLPWNLDYYHFEEDFMFSEKLRKYYSDLGYKVKIDKDINRIIISWNLK